MPRKRENGWAGKDKRPLSTMIIYFKILKNTDVEYVTFFEQAQKAGGSLNGLNSELVTRVLEELAAAAAVK